MLDNFISERLGLAPLYFVKIVSIWRNNGRCTILVAVFISEVIWIPLQLEIDWFVGGALGNEQQSFTCPYCGKCGFSETSLCKHLGSQHSNASTTANSGNASGSTATTSTSQPAAKKEVVCPICAVLPNSNGGDPNHLTDNLLQHINLEHVINSNKNTSKNLDDTLNDIGIDFGITYFDSKFFPVFFKYFMKYYLKPQNSIHFKSQLIEIYKMAWLINFQNL